ncbi:MAG: ATP-binding cassette domain-containing protein [Alphaproteobacteria bacterium]|jgi:sodium transport system ATP-binding protein|nr:ATP-binding cassette domain-containing protein [Alphaproteobacteria bacterium]|tara:strand:+ start:1512 stop:2261 length:750 start_codon:yes stop_codon:yes gene_type:complete
MIEALGLCKAFPPLTALDEVDFAAADGRVTGLIGPNGAGKTTALRILYTLMRPDAGSARVDGFDTVAERRQVQSRIGVLPDNRGLYQRLTARQHVRYFGRLHGLGGGDLEARIERLVETLGMTDFVDRRAKGFSKGQSVKVALARALVHRPQNILLDEPTNGLDVNSARTVHELIRQHRTQGRCILICSHLMQEVAQLCDHLVVLAVGRVVIQGSPDELRRETGESDLEDVFLALTGTRQPGGTGNHVA